MSAIGSFSEATAGQHVFKIFDCRERCAAMAMRTGLLARRRGGGSVPRPGRVARAQML
jgi:hypothetical protein